MAADEDTQDVRRTLKERPPEELPPGAEDRLRQRLDEESSSEKTSLKTPKPAGAKHK